MDNKYNNLHLYLGLTRNELKKRLELGLIDPELLKMTITETAQEIKLSAASEAWFKANEQEQVDKQTLLN